MTLQRDLLFKGYLPEGMAPFFTSKGIAECLSKLKPKDYLTKGNVRQRASPYSASKRGLTRRVFSVMHPVTAYDCAKFVDRHLAQFGEAFGRSAISLSKPVHESGTERAVSISSHSQFEEVRMERLAPYRFVVKTDISRFYHSIYTHSVPWAMHGKAASKADTLANSTKVVFNKLDQIIRNGQDGQTIGIPVGPDVSRYIAELISSAIDAEFSKNPGVESYEAIRHVDDVYIGAHTHADAEKLLWRYREAVREFELDINETKTRIYSSDFRFADAWPVDLSEKIRSAFQARSARRRDRLRAALEDAFALAVNTGDDGVLKYVIRALDDHGLSIGDWEIVEPFLKRCVVHFGHTVDYVSRMLVWQDLVNFSFQSDSWKEILIEILNRHGRLGNDGEVTWAMYACYHLGVPIPHEVALVIASNCSAVSVVALLNCVEKGLVGDELFETGLQRIKHEDARGQYWPLLLEWVSRSWPDSSVVEGQLKCETVAELCKANVSIFDGSILPRVFQDRDPSEFSKVKNAIEKSDFYEDDVESEDDDFPAVF